MRPVSRVLVLAVSTALASSSVVGLTSSAHAAGGVFGNGTPGFAVSAADVQVPLTPILQGNPDVAGEPSIGIDQKTGAGLFMAGTDTLKVTFDPSTSKVTWADASPFFGSSQNLDPILATDPTTGTTLAGGDDGACGGLFRSTDDGASWLPTAPCTGTYDHPTVAWAPSALTPGAHVWYYCQQGPDEHNCSASTDDGVTWLPGTTTGLLTCIGIHGHLRGGADGYAYLPGKSCFDASSNLVVGGEYTHDDGASWTEYTIPGATETAFDPAVTVAPNGRLYEAWEDGTTSHPMIAWSEDHGATWSSPVDLASTVSTTGQVASSFPTLVSGDDGRLAYSYLASSVGTGNPNASGYHGVWYLYTSYSYDGGTTWTTVKDTPTPVQYGEVDSGGTTTTGQRNLLDFIDSSLTKDGRVVVAFADGCLQDCEQAGAAGGSSAQTNAEALSTHAWASVAWQSTGRGLLSAYDVVVAPGAPTLTATSAANGAQLAWTAPADNGGGAISSYQVFRDGTLVATTPATTTTFVDTAATHATHSYTVRAVNSAGPGAASAAVSAATYVAPGAPTLVVSGTGSTAQLSWSLSDDGGAPVTSYTVLRGTASGTETTLASTAGTTFTDSGLAVGTTYYYEVLATNAAGDGPASTESAYATAAPPGAPVLTATAGKGQVTLAWTAPSNGGAAITGYSIYRGTSAGTETLVQTITTGTTYVDPGLTGGTTYWYRVAAVNAAGTGALSNEVSATPKKG